MQNSWLAKTYYYMLTKQYLSYGNLSSVKTTNHIKQEIRSMEHVVHLPNPLHSVCLNRLSCTEVEFTTMQTVLMVFSQQLLLRLVHQGPNVYCF